MSRAHLEVRIVNGDVLVVDCHSTNGVFMREPDQLDWTRLQPWEPALWRPGSYVQLGGRILRLHASNGQVAQRGPRVNLHHHVPREMYEGRA